MMKRHSNIHNLVRSTFILGLLILPACAHLGEAEDPRWRQAVARFLAKEAPSAETLRATTIAGERILFPTELLHFYRTRHYQPAWLASAQNDGESAALLDEIEKAVEHGLSPAHYHRDALRTMKQDMQSGADFAHSARLGAEREALLSDAFLAYAHDLASGVITPSAVDENWSPERPKLELAKTLETALRERRVGAVLREQAPQSRGYRALQEALRKYQAAGEARAEELRVALERWRWLPRELGDRYILVDIAGFELTLFDHGRPALTMPVIVGKPSEPTPVFDDTITYLVMNPSWTVPKSILLDELLPHLKEDPGYLAKKELRVFDGPGKNAHEVAADTIDWNQVGPDNWKYYLRQEAGARNPLGKIKFMFPNRFAVYLHGTPLQRHFARAVRTESHGCIRVARAEELAGYLLKDNRPAWDEPRIQDALAEGEEQAVKLSRPIPVHLFYSSVTVDEHGEVRFRRDIYHWDRPARLALERAQQASSVFAR